MSISSFLAPSKTSFAIKELKINYFKLRGTSIYRGILTGYNKAFVISNETKEELIRQDPKSAELIKPVLRGKDIQKYWHNWEKTRLWLIATFPALKIDIDCYPAVKKYLLSFGKRRLEQTGTRFPDGTKSRKKTTHAWYELQDTCAYHEEFEKDKIVWSDISTSPTFALLSDNLYINNTAYLLNSDSKYLLGILNSDVVKYYMSLIATELGEKGCRYFKQFVEKLPVPQVSEAKQANIAEIVEKILHKKISSPSSDTSNLEREVNCLILNIYQLEEKEKAIVLG